MISVVIAHHEGKYLLGRCLESLLKSKDVELEVIVVDNASSDGSKEMLRQGWAVVHILELEANTGFASASNCGIRASKGDVVLLLNNDVLVYPGCIAALWSFAKRTPAAGAIVPVLRNPDGSLQRSSYSWPKLTKSLLHLAGLDALVSRLRLKCRRSGGQGKVDREPRRVKVAKFACVLLTKECLEKVGPLDASFFMYGEDADWSARACKKGFWSYVVPNAEAVHLSLPRAFDSEHPMFVHQNLGALIYHRKHSKRYQYYLLSHLGTAVLRLRLAFARKFDQRNVQPLCSLLSEIECKGL